jgi:hypothetical protein
MMAADESSIDASAASVSMHSAAPKSRAAKHGVRRPRHECIGESRVT